MLLHHESGISAPWLHPPTKITNSVTFWIKIIANTFSFSAGEQSHWKHIEWGNIPGYWESLEASFVLDRLDMCRYALSCFLLFADWWTSSGTCISTSEIPPSPSILYNLSWLINWALMKDYKSPFEKSWLSNCRLPFKQFFVAYHNDDHEQLLFWIPRKCKSRQFIFLIG